MFDHYVINVSRRDGTTFDGKPRFFHFFATAPHSLRDRQPALEAFAVMQERFPEADGFKVEIRHWVARGHEVEL